MTITMPPTATDSPAPKEEEPRAGETSPSYLSTMPSSNFTWQITLADKVVAITGANRGIGLGIAEVCLANAARVVYSLDLMEPGQDYAALQKRYPNFRYINADVTSQESAEKAVNQIVEETGRIDGLVANAGMTKHQPALDFDRPQLEQLFNLNVGCCCCCCVPVAEPALTRAYTGVWVLFLRPGRRAEIHRAGHQGVHCHDFEYDFVSSEQGKSTRRCDPNGDNG